MPCFWLHYRGTVEYRHNAKNEERGAARLVLAEATSLTAKGGALQDVLEARNRRLRPSHPLDGDVAEQPEASET